MVEEKNKNNLLAKTGRKLEMHRKKFVVQIISVS